MEIRVKVTQRLNCKRRELSYSKLNCQIQTNDQAPIKILRHTLMSWCQFIISVNLYIDWSKWQCSQAESSWSVFSVAGSMILLLLMSSHTHMQMQIQIRQSHAVNMALLIWQLLLLLFDSSPYRCLICLNTDAITMAWNFYSRRDAQWLLSAVSRIHVSNEQASFPNVWLVQDCCPRS